ncbi:neuropeptides capa receptor-like [Homalodisca vitripennis]|nr:neuropeptides capa receptor-like [Homalodisca vitripennis]XP_046666091.1 neuropeptides capa receptor-like [Homalodisca vitripennis]
MNEVWAVDEVWGVDKVLSPNATNITVEEYLLNKRGPKHLSLTVVIPVTVVYTTIFISGVIGNLATCLVIVSNASLHTATNYYLFSLAVSDITLLLLGLPNDLSVFWQQYPWQLGEPICKLRALVSEMTSYTSVMTIVAFSMERYLAICHPLLSYTMSGLSRAVRIITVLWSLSFFSALPFAILTKVDYITYPPGSDEILEESAFCALLEENIPHNLPIYEISFFIFFVLPLCILLVLYTKIGLRIRSKSLDKNIDGKVHGETKKFQSRKSIIRMLAAVVVTFFLCWAPYHAQRLHYLYGLDSPYYYEINEYLYYVAGCFYYLSSTANPILYNLMSVKYRAGFQRTFCGRGHRLHSSSSGGETRCAGSLTTRPPDPDTGWGDQALMKRNVVVRISDENRATTTVKTESTHWPWTRLRVTMDRPHPSPSTRSEPTICVEMETCL